MTLSFYTDESLLAPYFKALKRMYELLSCGVSFYDHETIKRFQLSEHAENWVAGKKAEKLNLGVHSIMYGKINAWQDRFIISANLQYGQDWTDDLRKDREKKHEGLARVFKRWQSEKNKTFDYWFEEESMEFGRITLQKYLDYQKRFADGKLTLNDVIPPPSVILIRSIKEVFRSAGVQDADILPKTVEYLTAPFLKGVPFIKISSMLWAALARKAATGKKSPPGQGMANDIAIISVLLPYCDAMFIDNECHAYLKENPLRDAINYGTRVFSQNTKDEFLEYLNEIETKASKEHSDKVDEVYGKTWREPYRTLYKEQKG